MITYILIGITVLISMRALQDRSMMEKLLFEPFQVEHRKEWYRFISHAFVHANGAHLFVNMFVLWMFGRKVEHQLGLFTGMEMTIFLVLYLSAAIVAAVPGFLRHRLNPEYRAVGASGAVAAVLFASIVMDPTDPLYLFGIVKLPGWILGIGYLAYEYVQDKKAHGRIAHDAHFTGALYGVLFMAAVEPRLLTTLVQRIMDT